MSFEQLDINRYEEEKEKKKKESEKMQAFLLEKKILSESSDLLSKLATEIAEEFWISILQAKEIISWKSLSSLDDLKSELSWNLENINYEKLFWAIEGAKVQIENISKSLREELKKSVDEDLIIPENFTRPITDIFIPQYMREKAYHPQNFSDQLIWIPLWLIDSTEAVILFTYSLGKWMLLTPYHIYLMLIGEAEFPYKNI